MYGNLIKYTMFLQAVIVNICIFNKKQMSSNVNSHRISQNCPPAVVPPIYHIFFNLFISLSFIVLILKFVPFILKYIRLL